MRATAAPLTDTLPDPPTIRARLTELAAEAELLRALLRLWEHRECGRELLRRRRRAGRPVATAG